MKNTLTSILLPLEEAKNDSVNGLLITNGVLHKPIAGGEYRRCIHNGSQANYIYLYDNSEIKVGDWFIANQYPRKCIRIEKGDYPFVVIGIDGKEEKHFHTWRNKIILTTDPILIADGVINIPGYFLSLYVKAYNELKKDEQALKRLDEILDDDKDGEYEKLYQETRIYSLDDMRKCFEAGVIHGCDTNDDSSDESEFNIFIKHLTPINPRSEMVIYVEMEK